MLVTNPLSLRDYPEYARGMIKNSIHTWVFDLDNTLYPASVRLFDQIEAKMEAYMVRELGIDLAEAKRIRNDYWHNHGTTLEGLVQVHGIDPDPFLDEVHDIDHSLLPPSPELADAINALPGKKIIYTNGSRAHGHMVSTALGLRDCFSHIYGIEDAGYRPKPKAEAFEKVFKAAKIDPTAAAMFEDDPRNLKVPHDLGMMTVLIGEEPPAPHIHHSTQDLTDFLTIALPNLTDSPILTS